MSQDAGGNNIYSNPALPSVAPFIQYTTPGTYYDPAVMYFDTAGQGYVDPGEYTTFENVDFGSFSPNIGMPNA